MYVSVLFNTTQDRLKWQDVLPAVFIHLFPLMTSTGGRRKPLVSWYECSYSDSPSVCLSVYLFVWIRGGQSFLLVGRSQNS